MPRGARKVGIDAESSGRQLRRDARATPRSRRRSGRSLPSPRGTSSARTGPRSVGDRTGSRTHRCASSRRGCATRSRSRDGTTTEIELVGQWTGFEPWSARTPLEPSAAASADVCRSATLGASAGCRDGDGGQLEAGTSGARSPSGGLDAGVTARDRSSWASRRHAPISSTPGRADRCRRRATVTSLRADVRCVAAMSESSARRLRRSARSWRGPRSSSSRSPTRCVRHRGVDVQASRSTWHVPERPGRARRSPESRHRDDRCSRSPALERPGRGSLAQVALDADDVLELLDPAHDPGQLRDRATWSVAVTTAVWSGFTWTAAATMLTLFSATTWVMSLSRPVRS